MAEQQPPQGDFPPVHPSGSDQSQFLRPDFLLKLPNFVAQFLEHFVGTVVKAILGIFIPGPVGSAFSQLENWATSLLPAQILQPIQDLVTALITLLGHIPVVGPVITQLADMFGFLNDNTTTAQSAADTANVGVAALNAQLAGISAPPGGVVVIDNFDRTGTDLGANWTWFYSGPGSGSVKTNGNDAYWDVAGAASRVLRAHHNTALASNMQMCSLVQTAPQNASNTDPELRLILRSDATLDNYVMANWTHNSAAIGYVVAGVYTQLGAAVSHSANTGARWEFRAGTATDNYTFELYLNDGLLFSRADAGHASVMGAANLYVGGGMLAGVTLDAFGFHQKAPPKIQGWAGADR